MRPKYSSDRNRLKKLSIEHEKSYLLICLVIKLVEKWASYDYLIQPSCLENSFNKIIYGQNIELVDSDLKDV